MLSVGCEQEAISNSNFQPQIRGNEVIFGGIVLTPSIPIKESKPKREGDTLFSVWQSKNRTKLILEIYTVKSNNEFRELWFVDLSSGYSRSMDLKTGRNVTVNWWSDNLFEVQSGGASSRVSEIISTNNVDIHFRISRLLYLDATRGAYVSFYYDGIEIGKLFDKETNREKIDLPLEYDSILDAMQTISHIGIDNNKIRVEYLIRDGRKIVKIIDSKVLD